MSRCSVEAMVLGLVGTNVYIVSNTQTKQALLVDPADRAEAILDKCKKDGLTIEAILLTHGHFDHILAAKEISSAVGAPIYVHEAELRLLGDARLNSSAKWMSPFTLTVDKPVKEGDVLSLAGFALTVLHTPGHTAGSCCYYLEEEGILISGDTLFRGSYGRTDLPTGNEAEIFASVRRLLSELPDKVQVFPGHMGATTIGFEKKHNLLVR